MWAFDKASNINPVVTDLLSIKSAHNSLHKLSLFVFYNLRPLNNMADHNSCRFYFITHPFIELFCFKYSPQSPNSWTM